VASLSVADRLLAYSGANEALAAMKPTLAKPGYGPLQFEKGKPFALPKGFRMVRFGRAGSKMSDGLPTPTCHDGSGYYKGRGDTVWIARNQEGFQQGRAHGPRNAYDPYAQGGVTVSHFDTRSGKLLDSALVLNGTDNNCHGGVTPWGTWLSGEENTVGAEQGYGAEHGYVFEMPGRATTTVEPIPIKAMGRFVHEACPVDFRSGIVYMTEDNGDPGDGFYRYLPDHKGKLHRGGKLQMLAVKDRPKYNTTKGQKVGEKLECRWVDIKDPDPNGADKYPQSVYMQGRKAGGAKFMGLEGGSFSKGSCYFTASDGGDAEAGQVWRYTPDNKDFKRGTLELLFESRLHRELTGPDAVCLSPRGGVLVCEDGASEDVNGRDAYIRYITPKGELHNFAKVTEPMQLHDGFGADLFPYNPERWENPPEKGEGVGHSEASGAGFSPDGKWLFVHLQYPGESFAITGPWEKGWL
jgi:secreted PhoX family phosphatase